VADMPEEPRARDLHRQTTGLMSVILVVLGVAIVVRTLAAGGGALALGLILGVLFVAAGLGRLYVNARFARGRAPRER
jgi:multisubunit Na+/H+ antiporter MnhB subunit